MFVWVHFFPVVTRRLNLVNENVRERKKSAEAVASESAKSATVAPAAESGLVAKAHVWTTSLLHLLLRKPK